MVQEVNAYQIKRDKKLGSLETVNALFLAFRDCLMALFHLQNQLVSIESFSLQPTLTLSLLSPFFSDEAP